ncbi:MAG: aminotransferase class IV [Oligoflexales bacterium]
MVGFASVNGNITSLAEASVPLLDRGFLFSDNVFEVFVAVQGFVLDCKKHLTRLRRSAETIGIPIPWSDEQLAFEIQALVDQVQNPKTYIRLVVTRGVGAYLKIPKDIQPQRYVICLPAAQESPSVYKDGVRLKTFLGQKGVSDVTPKTGNYLPAILAMNQAQKESYDDVLWTNAHREITEAGTANIFFVGRHGDLVEIATPPLASGILEGITRSTIIELLERSKIPVTQRVIDLAELARFDEAFLSSTVKGLVPVQVIDQKKFFTLRPQSVFNKIQSLYLTWVQTQVGGRVDWNSGAFVRE